MKKKLKLHDLKVKSFVTDISQREEKTLKGGATGTLCSIPCTKWNSCICSEWISCNEDCSLEIKL